MMPGALGREMTPPRLERTPMNLSRASRHVVQALVHLARQRPGVWVTAQEIGQAEGISDKFLGNKLHRIRGSPSPRNKSYPDRDALRALARFGTGVAARVEPTRWGI